MIKRFVAPLLVAASVFAADASAQDAPPTLPQVIDLRGLLQLVVQRSPRLAAERVGIDSAKVERETAGLLPNPSLSLGRYKPAAGVHSLFDGSSQQQVSVDFPLLIGNQRSARIDAAEQGVLAAQARVGAVGSELAARAAELFVGLQAVQEKVQVLESSFAESQRLAAIVAGRLRSGVASRYELTRVEVELAGLANKLDEARIERANRSAGIAALIGVADWRPAAAGVLKSRSLPTDLKMWRGALSRSNAQIAAARKEEDAANAALRRAEHERWPVPVLTLARQWTQEPFGAANFVGVSAEIPILDKRLGPVAKAQAELHAARRRRQALEAEIDAELARLLQTLVQRRAALEQFEAKVGKRLPALKEMAEDAYRLGRGTILELIDAERSRLEASLVGIELRALTVDQELRVLVLAGKLEG